MSSEPYLHGGRGVLAAEIYPTSVTKEDPAGGVTMTLKVGQPLNLLRGDQLSHLGGLDLLWLPRVSGPVSLSIADGLLIRRFFLPMACDPTSVAEPRHLTYTVLYLCLLAPLDTI